LFPTEAAQSGICKAGGNRRKKLEKHGDDLQSKDLGQRKKRQQGSPGGGGGPNPVWAKQGQKKVWRGETTKVKKTGKKVVRRSLTTKRAGLVQNEESDRAKHIRWVKGATAPKRSRVGGGEKPGGRRKRFQISCGVDSTDRWTPPDPTALLGQKKKTNNTRECKEGKRKRASDRVRDGLKIEE